MKIDPDQAAIDIPYVVFDFETTGLDSQQDSIIEIGAVKLEQGIKADHFVTLINPLTSIPAQASAINSITDETVADAPTLDEKFPEFLKFIQGCVLVAHNANFDSRFLTTALKKYRITDLENYVMDTLTLSHRIYPQCSTHSLKDICQRLNFKNLNAHRAYEDAQVTAKIFIEFLTQLHLKGHRTFRQVATVHGTPLGRIKGSNSGQSVHGYIENMSSSLF